MDEFFDGFVGEGVGGADGTGAGGFDDGVGEGFACGAAAAAFGEGAGGFEEEGFNGLVLNPDGEGVDEEGVASEGADAETEFFHVGEGVVEAVGIGGGKGDGFGGEQLLLGDGGVLEGVHELFV